MNIEDFKIGTEVEIIKPTLASEGCSGKVVDIFDNLIKVKITDRMGWYVGNNHVWLSPSSLRIIGNPRNNHGDKVGLFFTNPNDADEFMREGMIFYGSEFDAFMASTLEDCKEVYMGLDFDDSESITHMFFDGVMYDVTTSVSFSESGAEE